MRKIGIVGAAVVLMVTLLAWATSSPASASSSSATVDGYHVKTLHLAVPTAYTPKAQAGGTDDYHRTLVNPHVTTNSYIVASHFYPGSGPSSVEVHHAIIFLVPPQAVPMVESLNTGNQGWSCFGESVVPNGGLATIGETPWLSAWAPGHGKDVLPAKTGTPMPAGSMVVMQVHYNMLVGDKPVKPSMNLYTVPAKAHLRPTSLMLMPAPPDIPCPAGTPNATAPTSLCVRSNAMNYLAQRFGQSAVGFDNTIETVCGRNPNDPPAGNTTSCTWPVYQSGWVVRTSAHMHLTGVAMTITLNPGTAKAKTLLNVPDYNFHFQRSYDLKHWVEVQPGDTIKVQCTYNPQLREELPQLRQLPPRFVVWGDGSSDEMCLGLVSTVPLNPHAQTHWKHDVGMLP